MALILQVEGILSDSVAPHFLATTVVRPPPPLSFLPFLPDLAPDHTQSQPSTPAPAPTPAPTPTLPTPTHPNPHPTPTHIPHTPHTPHTQSVKFSSELGGDSGERRDHEVQLNLAGEIEPDGCARPTSCPFLPPPPQTHTRSAPAPPLPSPPPPSRARVRRRRPRHHSYRGLLSVAMHPVTLLIHACNQNGRKPAAA